MSPFLHEFAISHGVQPESLIFGTTTMPNISIPSSVTARDLLRKEDKCLSVFVKNRDRKSRRRTQPVAVDLGPTFLQASNVAHSPKITEQSHDLKLGDASSPSVDASTTLLQILRGTRSCDRKSPTTNDQLVGGRSDEEEVHETDRVNENTCNDSPTNKDEKVGGRINEEEAQATDSPKDNTYNVLESRCADSLTDNTCKALESHFPDHLTATCGNNADCPVCQEPVLSHKMALKTTCNHFLHGPCMLEWINTAKYRDELELDIICPCAGCGVYETSKQKHWVIVSGSVTGNDYKTSEEIGWLKELRDPVTVERLPHGRVKTSEITFQHK